MHSAKEGEEAQFNRRWRPALMSFFMRRIRSSAEAEDLTQEVFLRLLGAGDSAGRFADAYVFRVAANLLRDRARRAQVRSRHVAETLANEERGVDLLDPHRIAADRETLANFTAALRELPERTRTFFILYRLENMSLDLIAESFGISKSAVKKHVARAMAMLSTARNDQ